MRVARAVRHLMTQGVGHGLQVEVGQHPNIATAGAGLAVGAQDREALAVRLLTRAFSVRSKSATTAFSSTCVTRWMVTATASTWATDYHFVASACAGPAASAASRAATM